MRCRVIGRRDTIHTFGNNAPVLNDHGAEGATSAGNNIVDGELNGASHEGVVHTFVPVNA
jgi:hypothetical protein